VNSLLPPNASPMEKAIVQVMVEMLDIATPMALLCNPDTIPLHLLPWLAWSLGLDMWNPEWPEAVKRNRVRQAITIARRKGSAQSVHDVAAAYGGLVTIREWFETEPPGEPFTAECLLTLTGISGDATSARYVDDVIGDIRRTKPARTHITFTQGVQASGKVGVIAIARPLAYAHLQFSGVN
jgi:phage tail P2-like protein